MATVRRITTTDRSPAAVASRWWYGIAALPVVSVLAVALVTVSTALAVGFGLLEGRFAGPVFGLLVLFAMVATAAVIAAGLLFPIALYLDSRAVANANVDWRPDVTVYTGLGVVAAFVHVLGIAVACYYLYRRHRVVGTP